MSEELKNVEETQEVWSNFIHDFIEEDIAPGGRFEGKKVHTRFLPNPTDICTLAMRKHCTLTLQLPKNITVCVIYVWTILIQQKKTLSM